MGSLDDTTYNDVWICVFAWNQQRNRTEHRNTSAANADTSTVKDGVVMAGFQNKSAEI